jgi:hypothetical protein
MARGIEADIGTPNEPDILGPAHATDAVMHAKASRINESCDIVSNETALLFGDDPTLDSMTKKPISSNARLTTYSARRDYVQGLGLSGGLGEVLPQGRQQVSGHLQICCSQTFHERLEYWP